MPGESINLLRESFISLWQGFVDFLEPFLIAVIIFLIGWIVAVIVGQVVARVIRALPVDTALEGLGFREALERAGLKLDTGKFIGELVKWYIIIAVFLAATDILGLTAVTTFLQKVLDYVPNVIVAALVLIATALVANFLQKTVKASVEAADLRHGSFVGAVAKWATWILGISTALSQLGIGEDLARMIIFGIIAMLALAAGLAFGLGGKEFAADMLDKLRKETVNK